MMGAAGRSHPRRAGLEDRFVELAPDLMAGVTPAMLHRAVTAALAPKPPTRVLLDHVAPIRASVADAVEELIDELPRAGSLTFRRLTAELGDRLGVIVRFLAVLELYKQGLIDLDQPHSFGELTITWLGPGAGLPVTVPVEEYLG
jgi:segregation and condensation protein A